MFESSEFNCWDDADRMACMAYEMYENGDMDLALSQLEEAIEINPNNSSWHFNKGLTLDAMDKYEDAIESYLQSLKINPDDPEVMNSLAVDYTRTGQYELALATFEKIQQMDPDFEPAYCNRIITYTEIDKHEQAEQMFYLAQQINPDCPICFYNIGNSLFSRQKYERAIWCWQRTAELEPTHPQINYRIAQAYWACGKFEKAQEYFLAELRNNPGDIDVILDYGIFLMKIGDNASAREKFNRILEMYPEFANPVFYLGELERSQGSMVEAQRFYLRASMQSPSLPGPRLRLAEMALDEGNYDKARQFMDTEYDLDISDSEVLLAMAAMFSRLGDRDHATDCLLRIVDEDNENAEAFYCLGKTLAMKGEYEGALQFYQHSISLGRKDCVTLADTAYLYQLNGSLEMALKTIEVARLADPKNKSAAIMQYRIKFNIIRNKMSRYMSTNKIVQKLILVYAGYKCRIRRIINSRKKTR